MKRVLKYVLIMMGLIMAPHANAQIADNNKTLKISPIQFGKSYFELSMEFDMNGGKSSLQISPMALLKKDNFEEFTGIQAEIQYRSYLLRLDREETDTWMFSDIDMFAGAYALGLIFSRDYKAWYNGFGPEPITEADVTQDILAIESGVVIGVKFTLGKRVTLGFLAGGGVRYSDIQDSIEAGLNIDDYYVRDNDSVFDLGYFGVKPRLNLQLGITL
ncbi:MAG: hypothetical protein ACO3M5_09930 [Saprospiraceae bacterium]|jgi:hypothetical protein